MDICVTKLSHSPDFGSHPLPEPKLLSVGMPRQSLRYIHPSNSVGVLLLLPDFTTSSVAFSLLKPSGASAGCSVAELEQEHVNQPRAFHPTDVQDSPEKYISNLECDHNEKEAKAQICSEPPPPPEGK